MKIKEPKSKFSGPPDDCPICAGQTEWAGYYSTRSFAMCFFCGHVFESSTPVIDEISEEKTQINTLED